MLYILLSILAAIIIVGIGVQWSRRSRQATRRRRLFREPSLSPAVQADAAPADDAIDAIISVRTVTVTQPKESIITLHVMAASGSSYEGYELLQALLANGLTYGEKNIFHRHQMPSGQGSVLFSLASANKPGTFNLSQMGYYTCPGLTLFMIVDSQNITSRLVSTFDLMLETAQQLREDLGGEILDDRRLPITADRITQLRKQLSQLQEQNSVSAIEG